MFAGGGHVGKRVGESEEQSRDTRLKPTIHSDPDMSPPAFSGVGYRASPGNDIACMGNMRYLKRRCGSYCLLTTGMRYRCVCGRSWNM
jgi:hypothetical protein